MKYLTNLGGTENNDLTVKDSKVFAVLLCI